MIKWLALNLGGIFTLKTFIGGLFMTILAVVLYNAAVAGIEEALNFAVAAASNASPGTVASPSITGFAGWFLTQCKVPECFAVMVSCVSIKFILRKIPFLKW